MLIRKSQYISSLRCEYLAKLVDSDYEVEMYHFDVGRQIHELAALYFQEGLYELSSDEILNFVDGLEVIPKVKVLFRNFLEFEEARKRIFKEHGIEEPKVVVERHFEGNILPIQGTPDRIDVFDGNLAFLYEYKSGSGRSPFIERELHFYKMLLEENGYEVFGMGVLYLGRYGKFKLVKFSRQIEDVVVREVMELMRKLKRDELKPNKRYCRLCAYRQVCDRYEE